MSPAGIDSVGGHRVAQGHNRAMLRDRRLVGRAAELADLERERRLVAAGEFRVVLLLADPGIGKTQLAREFLARNRRRTIGLSARAFPLGASASFGVWSEAFEHYFRGLRPDEVTRLCGGYLDDLAALLHSVAVLRGSAPDREPPRVRLLQGLAAALSNLAAESPVIALLDDAHVADASSWEALSYLAHALPRSRVLVLVAARPTELADNAEAMLAVHALEQESVLRRLRLDLLDVEALNDLAAGMLGERPPPQLVTWLDQRSRGNALFALGLLEALLDEGADLTAPALKRLPEDLAERVETRLRALDEPSVATLQSLAVVGRRIDARELAAVTGLSSERLAPVLEQLVRSKFVTEAAHGRNLSYELAHPLLQEAIYQRISEVRRRALHRLAGRALLAAARLGEAAPHFARSAEVGDDEAVRALCDAVRQAEERGAYHEALVILDTLVELVPVGDERWLDVLEALSWQAEWVVDHRADSNARLGIKAMRAIDDVLSSSVDPAARAMVKFRLANFLAWGIADLDAAERACEEARSLFDEAGARSGALLAENELAWIHGLRNDYPAMQAVAEHVLASAEAVDDRFATIQGLTVIAQASFFRGRFAEAEWPHRRSIAIAEEEAKTYRLTTSRALLACSLAFEGRPAEGAGLVEVAKEAPEWRETLLPEWEAIVQWFAGDFRGALASSQEAVAQLVGELSKRRALGVAFGALAAVEAGQAARARDHLSRVWDTLGGSDFLCAGFAAAHAEALLNWSEGRQSDALVGLSEVADGCIAAGAAAFAALVLLDLAELAAELGDAAIAADASRRLSAISQEIDRDLYHALAAMASGWSSLADGSGLSAETARRAVELLSSSSCRGFRARALEQLARALRAADTAPAQETFGEAMTLFRECGAVWRLDRARELKRAVYGSGHRRLALPGDDLSERERQVARLVVDGLTAREIGEQLFISRRTVETHLANVYAKLGVRSKVELVGRASELTLNQ
jgi:DNA-binding NarL/FixJ family response regulator